MWSSFCPQKKHVTVHQHTTEDRTDQRSNWSKKQHELANYGTLRHTLLFLWLKGVDSNIRHWLDSNQVNVKISLALDPFLRQSKQSSSLKPNISLSSWNVPTVLLSHSLYIQSIQILDLVCLKPPKAQPLIGLERGWKEALWTGSGWAYC